MGWIVGLVGGVVVVRLCWSVVVGFGFDFGFDCVGLSLIVFFWVCCDWFLNLGWFVY